jgi:hypothetical protein
MCLFIPWGQTKPSLLSRNYSPSNLNASPSPAHGSRI